MEMKKIREIGSISGWSQSRVGKWWVSIELIELCKLSIPIMLTVVLQQTPIFVSLFFVGWIDNEGEEESSLNLDAAALGSSFVNITGFAVVFGLSTAADTLSSQIYGFGDYKRVGIIFQRGLLFLLLVCMFIICFWLNTESILLLFQQKPCVASYTGLYVNIFILALPLTALYVLLQKFLQTQSVVWPFILVALLTNIVNAVLHTIFIFWLKMGIQGAAAALVIVNVFQPLILTLYVKIRKLHKKTWGGWSLESLEGWPEYIKLAVPGMLMVLAEWLGFEISSLVLGTVSEVELAVNGILVAYTLQIFLIPYGVGVAVSIRVGNELGAGNAVKAKRALYVALGVMAFIAVTVLSVTFGLRKQLGSFYNAEEEVQKRLETAVYLLCAQLFADQLQAVLSGILRGTGHQFSGAIINSISYYVIGLPVGVSLALATDMGSIGMWIGLALASNIQCVCIGIIVACLNWSKEVERAIKRMGGQSRLQDRPHPPDEGEKKGNGEIKAKGGPGIQLTQYSQLKQNEDDQQDISRFGGRLKLICCHVFLVVTACVCLIAAGILSMYRPPDSIVNGNYSECTFMNETF